MSEQKELFSQLIFEMNIQRRAGWGNSESSFNTLWLPRDRKLFAIPSLSYLLIPETLNMDILSRFWSWKHATYVNLIQALKS